MICIPFGEIRLSFPVRPLTAVRCVCAAVDTDIGKFHCSVDISGFMSQLQKSLQTFAVDLDRAQAIAVQQRSRRTLRDQQYLLGEASSFNFCSRLKWIRSDHQACFPRRLNASRLESAAGCASRVHVAAPDCKGYSNNAWHLQDLPSDHRSSPHRLPSA